MAKNLVEELSNIQRELEELKKYKKSVQKYLQKSDVFLEKKDIKQYCENTAIFANKICDFFELKTVEDLKLWSDIFLAQKMKDFWNIKRVEK